MLLETIMGDRSGRREKTWEIISVAQVRVEGGLDWVVTICQIVKFGMLFGDRTNRLCSQNVCGT